MPITEPAITAAKGGRPTTRARPPARRPAPATGAGPIGIAAARETANASRTSVTAAAARPSTTSAATIGWTARSTRSSLELGFGRDEAVQAHALVEPLDVGEGLVQWGAAAHEGVQRRPHRSRAIGEAHGVVREGQRAVRRHQRGQGLGGGCSGWRDIGHAVVASGQLGRHDEVGAWNSSSGSTCPGRTTIPRRTRPVRRRSVRSAPRRTRRRAERRGSRSGLAARRRSGSCRRSRDRATRPCRR